MTEGYNDDFNWDENWLGEPVADYSSFSKSQFLEDIGRRLTNVMLRCLTVCRVLPNRYEAQHFSQQLIRSASSFAANFRAVRRSRSSKEYFAKLSLVIEELDESLFWLETLVAAQLVPEQRLADLIDEGYQLLKILSKSRKTVSD
jgi:four helix bundle protein